MSVVEVLGYVASGVIFTTFWMKTIVTLRAVAIVGNVLYLIYGIYTDLGNIVLLHGALLPLNGLRLSQALRLRAKIHDMAHAEYDVRKLLAFMSRFECKAGTALFARGDAARGIYYLLEGRVRIAELGVEVAPGQLVGEIAMFTPDRQRTQTVECLDDCVFMRLTEDKTMELYAENPEFGLYLTKMMVQRLLNNAERTSEAAVA